MSCRPRPAARGRVSVPWRPRSLSRLLLALAPWVPPPTQSFHVSCVVSDPPEELRFTVTPASAASLDALPSSLPAPGSPLPGAVLRAGSYLGVGAAGGRRKRVQGGEETEHQISCWKMSIPVHICKTALHSQGYNRGGYYGNGCKSSTKKGEGWMAIKRKEGKEHDTFKLSKRKTQAVPPSGESGQAREWRSRQRGRGRDAGQDPSPHRPGV